MVRASRFLKFPLSCQRATKDSKTKPINKNYHKVRWSFTTTATFKTCMTHSIYPRRSTEKQQEANRNLKIMRIPQTNKILWVGELEHKGPKWQLKEMEQSKPYELLRHLDKSLLHPKEKLEIKSKFSRKERHNCNKWKRSPSKSCGREMRDDMVWILLWMLNLP